MTNSDGSRREWPDGDPERELRPPISTGRWARIMRAIGDVFLTAGMARGLTDGSGRDATQRATTNVILFGEADAQGREANRGSGPD